jgi:thiol-disulfide isomerase/thioredoxin
MCALPSRQWGLLLALLLSMAAAPLGAAQPSLTHDLTPVASSPPAPALRLPDLDGEIIELASLSGQVVVVNFWATWCPPCRHEMPSLERLVQKTRDRGVTVLAVNIGEDVDTVSSFLSQLDPAPSFPLLFDQEAGTLEAWDVVGLPTTIVVAPDGTLAYRAVGGREFDHPVLIERLLGLHGARPNPQ